MVSVLSSVLLYRGDPVTILHDRLVLEAAHVLVLSIDPFCIHNCSQ